MAEEVMAAKRPAHQQQLGRKVRNYDEDRWNAACKDIVKRGNIAKFSQNSRLKTVLLETKGTVLAEASPHDIKWGIGYPHDHPCAERRKLWRGTNLLGQVLTEVRDELLANGDVDVNISMQPVAEDAKEGYTLFWRSQSPFSQWHPAPFTLDGVTYNCAEQYMMYQKALFFDDAKIAQKVLEEKDPRFQKSLAKNVKNFDEGEWNKVSQSVVKKGSLAKYRQNRDLRRELFATAYTVLVEASKDDCRWGIGSTKDDPQSWRCQTWRGYNWLGSILTETRNALMEEYPDECNLECSRDRDHAGISFRAFSRPGSPFHMFYPACIRMNDMMFTSAGQYMLYMQAEFSENIKLSQEIMAAEEQEKLMSIQCKMTPPPHVEQAWFERLQQILRESNSVKFNSSDELRLKLINTGSDTLVYAAEEPPLGIDYKRHYFGSTCWQDRENWLGSMLMSLRDKLQKSARTVGSPPTLIPGLPHDSDRSRSNGKSSTHLNDRLSRAVEEKCRSERQHSARRSSESQSARQSWASHSERSDVTFTEDDSPFHLWCLVEVKIDGEVYDSAGHYLVEQSLKILTEDIDRRQFLQDATIKQDVYQVFSQSNVDRKTWHRMLQDKLLDKANEAKFSENAELRRKLLGTGDERIIFACKTDRFLGSGCSAEELSETKTYHGKNWLGKSLMKLRGKLQEEQTNRRERCGNRNTAQMNHRQQVGRKRRRKADKHLDDIA